MKPKSILVMFCLLAVSCSQKHVDQPSVPELCKTQLVKFIEEGTKTNTMAQQGVPYKDLRQQIANTKSAYELVSVSCAATLLGDSKMEYDKAVKGWDLTIRLCGHDEDYHREPGNYALVFSSSDEYREFMQYADDRLETTTDAGGTFLTFTHNISILSSSAGEHFLAGRNKILQILQKP